MPKTDLAGLFARLIATTRPEEMQKILADLGDSTDVGLDEEIGSSGLVWHAVGDNPGNLSVINLATKPGRSLTERVTNGMDAILEKRAQTAPSPLPRSPREAAQTWFQRPVSGPDQGLFNWDYAAEHYDRLISVALLESGREDAPSVDVWDAGVGISAVKFPDTILSLRSAGNKITKFHLIGAFGQGGSASLAFADYTIYASRHVDAPGKVAFTVIRVLRLSDTYKEDCYAYLALKDSPNSQSVLETDIGGGPIELYPPEAKAPGWVNGTLVRHIAFKLHGLTATLSSSPGNLYHYLHLTLFDPLLPFRVIDVRDDAIKNELVSGSRNRLMRLTKKKKGEESDGRTDLRHYRPMEYVVPHGETDASIGIEYWVVLNWKKPAKGKTEPTLRPSSNELFVQRNNPIVGTLNGQNQGELSTAILRKLNLATVARHMVVHIDASKCPSHVRRELFSSTREGFKDGPVLATIERVLTLMIEKDQELARIERELAERMLDKENKKTEDEVKEQITKLLIDTGMSVLDPGRAPAPGEGEDAPVPPKPRPIPPTPVPLPTLPYPQVTKWTMTVPSEAFQIRIGDYELVLIETDADAEFDRRGAIAIRSEPSLLEVGTKGALAGGRIRWRMRVSEGVQPSQTGKIIASITRPDGSQLTASQDFTVLAAMPKPSKPTKTKVPPFEVLPIDPTKDEDREKWGQLWPDLADETDWAKLSVPAYKVDPVAGKKYVYFNTLFTPYRVAEEGYRLKSPAVAAMFQVQYKVWIGYHALLQEVDSADELNLVDEKEKQYVERVLEEETIRVATMQVKQATQVVELKRAMMKAAPEEVTV